jgi:iron complex outermembrane receptor protein
MWSIELKRLGGDVARFIRRHQRVVVVVLATMWLAVCPAVNAMADSVEFDIAAQPMPQALKRFAAQAHVQLLFDYKAVEALKTSTVRGRFEAADALGLLLRGTGLTFQQVNDHTIAISRAGPTSDARDASQSQSPSDPANSQNPGTGVQLTQVAQGQGVSDSSVEESKQQESKKPKTEQLQEVVVTGSRLLLTQGSGVAPVSSYTAADIERSGQVTVADFLNTLPEVSANSIEPTYIGTTVQLRGLPVGSTLVLINGHRIQSSSGLTAAFGFFDLNQIPASAIERIDVMPDGGSAVYGGDALAGVVNIILKEHIQGIEADVGYGGASGTGQTTAALSGGWHSDTISVSAVASFLSRTPLYGSERAITASQDFRPYGGLDERATNSDPGNVYSVDGSNLPGLDAPYAAVPIGSTGVGLTPASFQATAGTLNRTSLYAYSSFIPQTNRSGLLLNASLRLDGSLELFSQLLASDTVIWSQYYPPALYHQSVPASNSFNPFGETVDVDYLFTALGPTLNIFRSEYVMPLLGLRGAAGTRWNWEIATWTSADNGDITNTNQLNSGNLVQALSTTNPANALNVFADGPGGSPALLDSLVSTTEDHFRGRDTAVNGFLRGPIGSIGNNDISAVIGAEFERTSVYNDEFGLTSADRTAYATFAELRLPLIVASGTDVVALQSAVRYDHYSDFGSRITPQVGIESHPATGLTVRASYSGAFKPPPLYSLYAPTTSTPGIVQDPRNGNETVTINGICCGNPALGATTGHTSSLAIAFTPAVVPSLSLTASPWAIRIENNIGLPETQYLVNNENDYPGRVVRGPTGTIVSVNSSYVNFGDTQVSGLDLGAKWNAPTPWGTFTPSVAVTDIWRYQIASTPGAPPTDGLSAANYVGYAPRWKGTASLVWRPNARFQASASGRYIGPYLDYYSTTRELGNIWFLDANASYDFGSLSQSDPRGSTILDIGGVNLLNNLPVYSNYFYGYDVNEYDLRGRFLYAKISVKW